MAETGHISIHTENILPIIKKWLYAEKDIYLRELISNSTDAIQKLEKIALTGEVTVETAAPKITVKIDKEAGTLTITDTGLGMTADEIKKYINQVAFSGVKDFVAKYQGKDDAQQIIGHFGLGFYSSFMVASRVEIDSLSYQADAVAAHWSCDGSTEFTLTDSDRKAVGTSIVLHIAEDSKEMLEQGTIRGILGKYCAFIKYPIELDGHVVNDPTPIWTKAPSTLEPSNYQEFFGSLFPFSPEPLFWIHLNVDFPFKLRGVLYFPRLQHELDASQGQVKLYCNQVYVADNCKELVPEFLTLLKGVIDCPDLPLNVSRSYLQNDPQVRLISQHITKKVADKLTGLAKTEPENYEKYWEDIHPFVKYGMLRDQKFFERMLEALIYKSSTGSYTTLDAYLERMKDKTEGKIIYASDPIGQAGHLSMLKENDMEAIIANTSIDQHFFPYLEMESKRKYEFQRVDADVAKHLIDASNATKIVDPTDNKNSTQKIEELFAKFLSNEKTKVRVESLKSTRVPAMLVVDENARRMNDMARFNPLMALAGKEYKPEQTLVVNENSSAIKNLLSLAKNFNKDEEVRMMVHQIFDLAYLQHGKFTAEAMQSFIDRSADILSKVGAES